MMIVAMSVSIIDSADIHDDVTFSQLTGVTCPKHTLVVTHPASSNYKNYFCSADMHNRKFAIST